MVVEKGYKTTEVGVIPDYWEVKTLGDITTLLTNGFVGSAKVHYSENYDDILYIQGYNVLENGFNFHGIKYVTKEFHSKHQKSSLKENDLLTVQTGDVGLTTIVTKELVGSNCHALIITRYKKGEAISKFISYYLNSNSGRSRLKLIETGTTMKHLNCGDMIQFLVPLPPLPEQTAIATALSDMDALIAQTEKLIEKKKAIKQGVMQELLRPKEGWVKKKISEAFNIFKGRGLSKNKISEYGEYPCILYGELFTTYKEEITEIFSKTNYSEAVNSVEGDILFPGSTTTTGADLAKASAIFKDGVQLGGDIIILRKYDFNLDSLFVTNFLNYYRKNEIAQLTKGITIHHLYGKDLSGIEIEFPNQSIQMSISNASRDFDLEISSLQKKLQKLIFEKQGMMQSLLTGKIRLV